mmetsp:Transcript_2237/g.5085  ORF Transcript_2237/g.5085 Transcript_2237/m.5085 type:complete len:331 (+) Transcript_2237:1148-2140(+)
MVETDHVRDLGFVVFVQQYVRVDHGFAGKQPVGQFFLAKIAVQQEFGLQVVGQQCVHPVDVLRRHFYQIVLGGVGHPVQFYHSRHGHPVTDASESDADQFLWVQGAMVVSRRCHGNRQHDPGRVDGLKDALQIDSARDFLDQHRRQSLRPEFFVNAQEIDFDHVQFRGSLHTNVGRDGRYKGDEFLARARSDSQQQVVGVSRGRQCPFEKFVRIVETEQGVVVFDIVVCQQHVEFIALRGVHNVQGAPFESGGHVVRIRTNLVSCFVRYDGPFGQAGFFPLAHGLCVPKGMTFVHQTVRGDPSVSQHLKNVVDGSTLVGLFVVGAHVDDK